MANAEGGEGDHVGNVVGVSPKIVSEEADDFDFSAMPPTLSERRSDKSGRSRDWTPRDALIARLRAIDRGECDPQNLVIMESTEWERNGGQFVDLDFTLAGPASVSEFVGIVERVQMRIASETSEIDGT